jgi:hypothetical protein
MVLFLHWKLKIKGMKIQFDVSFYLIQKPRCCIELAWVHCSGLNLLDLSKRPRKSIIILIGLLGPFL